MSTSWFLQSISFMGGVSFNSENTLGQLFHLMYSRLSYEYFIRIFSCQAPRYLALLPNVTYTPTSYSVFVFHLQSSAIRGCFCSLTSLDLLVNDPIRLPQTAICNPKQLINEKRLSLLSHLHIVVAFFGVVPRCCVNIEMVNRATGNTEYEKFVLPPVCSNVVCCN